MIKIIKEVSKEDLMKFVYHIDVSDKNLYSVLERTPMGVFQFSGGTAEGVTKRVKPESFQDIVAINAFARPGTIDFLPQYLENKENNTSTYPPKVNELLNESHGTIIFQEQAMSIFNKIGGFTLEKTNYLRGLMKKLGKADKKPEDLKRWDEEIAKFEEGAKSNGLTNTEARRIADDMLMMSSYSFNKSHAVAYSYNGLITMYLTYYFRKYFYSAIIEYTMDRDRESVPEILKQIKSYGYDIIPPDVNKSKAKTYVDGNNIYIGLRNLKQIGDEVAEAIVGNSPYRDFTDFLVKSLNNSKINKRSISSLVKFGCFDKLEPELNRKQMINSFTYFWDEKKAVSKSVNTKNLLERCSVEEILEQDDSIRNYINTWKKKKEEWKKIDYVPVTTEYLKELEQESIGFNYFISPFNSKEMETFTEGEKRGLLKSTFNSLNQVGVSWRVPVFINKMRIINDKNGNEMAFVDIEDMTGNSVSIPVFASFWKFINDKVIDKSVCLMFLYRNDKQQVMLGLNKFVKDESIINKFVVPIRKTYG